MKTLFRKYGWEVFAALILVCLASIAGLGGCGGAGGGGSSLAPEPMAATAVPAPVTVQIKTVVFMGDSITAAWPLDDYFKTTLNINKGNPGETPADMVKRFAADVLALKPAVVVILAGTNAPYLESIPDIITMAKEARTAGITPIICLIPPRTSYMGDFDNALSLAADSEGFQYVDYFKPMTLPDGSENPALFKDGTHPNDAGYAVMAAVLVPALGDALK